MSNDRGYYSPESQQLPQDEANTVIFVFVALGIGVGLALALLFASNKEEKSTQEKVVKQARGRMKSTRKKMNESLDDMSDEIERLRERLEDRLS
jgi:hypothetical protein